MEWWRKNPAELQSVRSDVDSFPNLSLDIVEGAVVVQGSWSVFGEYRFIRDYEVRIVFPDDYPLTPPLVFETGGAIPPKRHLNGDGTCCLFAPPERWEKWPLGSSFASFLNGAVKEYFFSQAHFDLTGEWPFGEWGHDFVGIYQYYQEKLDVASPDEMLALIRNRNLSKKKSKLVDCPCGKKKKYFECHFFLVDQLSSFLPEHEWNKIEGAIRDLVVGLREERLERALSRPPKYYKKSF